MIDESVVSAVNTIEDVYNLPVKPLVKLLLDSLQFEVHCNLFLEEASEESFDMLLKSA